LFSTCTDQIETFLLFFKEKLSLEEQITQTQKSVFLQILKSDLPKKIPNTLFLQVGQLFIKKSNDPAFNCQLELELQLL